MSWRGVVVKSCNRWRSSLLNTTQYVVGFGCKRRFQTGRCAGRDLVQRCDRQRVHWGHAVVSSFDWPHHNVICLVTGSGTACMIAVGRCQTILLRIFGWGATATTRWTTLIPTFPRSASCLRPPFTPRTCRSRTWSSSIRCWSSATSSSRTRAVPVCGGVARRSAAKSGFWTTPRSSPARPVVG
jgi:hypothetical protein